MRKFTFKQQRAIIIVNEALTHDAAFRDWARRKGYYKDVTYETYGVHVPTSDRIAGHMLRLYGMHNLSDAAIQAYNEGPFAETYGLITQEERNHAI